MTDDKPRDGETADDAQAAQDPPAEQPLDIDAEFARIVSSFGDRAEVDPDPPAEPTGPTGTLAERFRSRGWSPDAERTPPREPAPESPELNTEASWDDEGHFVPPEPPAFELPEPKRLAAWAGVLGAPVLTVILAFAGLAPSGLFLLFLALAFIGGFGYLVYTMDDRDDDPWGNGAVL